MFQAPSFYSLNADIAAAAAAANDNREGKSLDLSDITDFPKSDFNNNNNNNGGLRRRG